MRLQVPVESDWREARRWRRLVEGLGDDEERERALARLVELSERRILEGWDAPWILPLRAEHARTLARAATDLGHSRLEAGAFHDALSLAPRSEAAISLAVRASVALGEVGIAQAALDRFAARVGGLSPRLTLLARELRRPAAPRPPLVVAPGPLESAFEAALEADPDAAVRFLAATPETLRRQRDLAAAKTLLGAALERPLSNEGRIRALRALGALHHRKSNFPEALDALRSAADVHAAGVEVLVLIESRRWNDAERVATEIVASTPPESYLNRAARMNLGGLHWHQNRLDDARKLYEALGAEDLDDLTRGFLQGNLACLGVVVGDWEVVENEARAACERLSPRLDALYSAFPKALLALARVAKGDAAALPDLAGAMPEPARMGARRVVQVLADYAAEGFAMAGDAAAAFAILDAGERLRKSIGHVRSPAE